MQTIVKRQAKELQVPLCQSFRQKRRTGEIEHGVAHADLSRHHTAGECGRELEGRDQQRKAELFIQREATCERPARVHQRYRQTAEECRSNIVRVPFDLCGKRKHFLPVEPQIMQRIGGGNTRRDQRGGRAKAPGNGNFGLFKCNRKTSGSQAACFQRMAIRGIAQVFLIPEALLTAADG